jgi:hypothetical protein
METCCDLDLFKIAFCHNAAFLGWLISAAQVKNKHPRHRQIVWMQSICIPSQISTISLSPPTHPSPSEDHQLISAISDNFCKVSESANIHIGLCFPLCWGGGY